jgi:hypothetical protein
MKVIYCSRLAGLVNARQSIHTFAEHLGLLSILFFQVKFENTMQILLQIFFASIFFPTAFTQTSVKFCKYYYHIFIVLNMFFYLSLCLNMNLSTTDYQALIFLP